MKQIMSLNALDYNHDVKFALKGMQNFNRLDLADFTDAVTNGQKFQNFLDLCYSPTNNSGAAALNSLKNLPSIATVSKKVIQLDMQHARN